MNAQDDVLPIYIGDDRTDEDAFKVCIYMSVGGIIVNQKPAGVGNILFRSFLFL